LTFARASNAVEVIELLTSNGCPEGPVNISGVSTLNRRKTMMNMSTTSSTNLIGKLEQGI
jgi:hypothetical protein